jgi:hypothetical protein
MPSLSAEDVRDSSSGIMKLRLPRTQTIVQMFYEQQTDDLVATGFVSDM